VVSDTLKIVHTKFSPSPISNVQTAKMKKAYGHNLYVINEEAMYTPDFQQEDITPPYEVPNIESSVLDS
jgi:hypothetical protein